MRWLQAGFCAFGLLPLAVSGAVLVGKHKPPWWGYDLHKHNSNQPLCLLFVISLVLHFLVLKIRYFAPGFAQDSFRVPVVSILFPHPSEVSLVSQVLGISSELGMLQNSLAMHFLIFFIYFYFFFPWSLSYVKISCSVSWILNSRIIHFSTLSLIHVPVLFQFLIIESYGGISSSLVTSRME